MPTSADIKAADDKLRIRLAEIDRDIAEANRMLDHDPFKWATRREALKRERVEVQFVRVRLQNEIRRDDEPVRSSAIFWGSNG